MKNQDTKLKVLFLSAEVTPLAKVGGLGDVAGALPPALFNLGVDIRLSLPFYGSIDVKKIQAKKIKHILVNIANKKEKVEIWQTILPGTEVIVYLIKHKLFDPAQIYSPLDAKRNRFNEIEIDIKRFSFYTKASLSASVQLGFKPDIVHANDWHTALAGDMLKTFNEHSSYFKNTKTLYTIHNLANQGLCDSSLIKFAEIDANLPQIKKDILNCDLNLMVQGLLGSDMANTVSPNYAKEMMTAEFGAGLERINGKRRKKIYGILNGIDIDFYNPETDKLIYKNFSATDLKLKKYNKIYLEKKLSFMPSDTPIVSIISRLVWQKGLDLITEILFDLPIRLVILGTGEKDIENRLKTLAKKFPDKMKLLLKFDEALAHQIYAGSDIFLMPSRFEPCGLGQMIAMRYGTVPVVRSTGGLKDTVNKNVGFKFSSYDPVDFHQTLANCLRLYYKFPRKWQKIMINGMKKDFSWNKSAIKYLKLYQKLLKP